MKTCGYQKKAWENLFYLLTFQDIEDNFDKKNNGYILITKTQSLNSVPNVDNISALLKTKQLKTHYLTKTHFLTPTEILGI